MRDIIAGFLRFQKEVFPARRELFKTLATGQTPKALFISCSDSRMVPELVTQREPGELFVIRNAGNIVPSYGPEPGGVSATVEFAVSALNVSDIVICGHSDCGAMKAIATCACLDHMPAVRSWLHHAVDARLFRRMLKRLVDHARRVGMVRANVVAQLNNLRTHPSVALAMAQNRLTLHGWVYDIENGSLDALDESTGNFVPLAEHPSSQL